MEIVADKEELEDVRIEVKIFSVEFFLLKRSIEIIFHFLPFHAIVDHVNFRGVGGIKLEDLIFNVSGIDNDAFEMGIFKSSLFKLQHDVMKRI